MSDDTPKVEERADLVARLFAKAKYTDRNYANDSLGVLYREAAEALAQPTPTPRVELVEWMIDLVERLADQQAMADDWWRPELDRLVAALTSPTVDSFSPSRDHAQSTNAVASEAGDPRARNYAEAMGCTPPTPAEAEALRRDCGTKFLPTNLTYHVRLAPGGGDLAYIWQDKPHRLLYDLCGEVERLTHELAELRGQPASKAAAQVDREGSREGQND